MTGAPTTRAGDVAAVAKALYDRGWMPGTAGNISLRKQPAEDRALITGSGQPKGELTERDMVCVRVSDSGSGSVHENRVRPSAETAIHTALYRSTGCMAVVHVHSPHATAVSTRYGRPGAIVTVPFGDYELIKGFGLADPSVAEVPVFPNWDEVARIGRDVERYLTLYPDSPPMLLIAGHGVTAWGASLAQARDRVECLEALCQVVILTGRSSVWTPEISA